MMQNPIDYDLYTLLEMMFLKKAKAMNCVKMGRIESFDPESQTASISVCDIKVLFSTPKDPQRLLEYPLLKEVPVHFFKMGTASIYATPKQGDFCILLFCDHNLDGWWSTGKGAPDFTENNHDIKDAVAIVGLSNNVNKINNFLMGLVLMFNDNNSIVINDGTITIKSPEITNQGNLTVTGNVTINGNNTTVGNMLVNGTLGTDTGASGSFATADNKTVTVVKGIITSIG